jgi:hypothetical protein
MTYQHLLNSTLLQKNHSFITRLPSGIYGRIVGQLDRNRCQFNWNNKPEIISAIPIANVTVNASSSHIVDNKTPATGTNKKLSETVTAGNSCVNLIDAYSRAKLPLKPF